MPTLTADSDPRIVPTSQISSIEFVIEFVIQTLDQIHCTIKSTSRSDPPPSVHVYAQEHTSIYIYIYTRCESVHIHAQSEVDLIGSGLDS